MDTQGDVLRLSERVAVRAERCQPIHCAEHLCVSLVGIFVPPSARPACLACPARLSRSRLSPRRLTQARFVVLPVTLALTASARLKSPRVQMRWRSTLVCGVGALAVAFEVSPAAAFSGPAFFAARSSGGAGSRSQATASSPLLLPRVARRQTAGVVTLQAAVGDAESREAKMERAKAMIDQVRGASTAHLDKKIDQVSDPDAAAEAIKEEKMARAKNLITKVRSGAEAGEQDDGEIKKTSSGIGGTW